ncbi:hypothetical protein [Moraxella sp. ZY200743]|uniref:hypothetical protein n=1 Tax=Moraxella sp. ZY200743 TaxID=2911970 RepID=UPI003D7CACE6
MTDDELIKQYFINPNIKGNVLNEEINHANELLKKNSITSKKKASKTIVVLLDILIALHIIPLLLALGRDNITVNMWKASTGAVYIVLLSALVFLGIRIIKPKNIKTMVTVILIVSLVCQYYLPIYLKNLFSPYQTGLLSKTFEFFYEVSYGRMYYPTDLLIFVWIPWLVIWLLYCSLSMQYKQYYK